MVIDLMKCEALGKKLTEIKEFQEKVVHYWIDGFPLTISREFARQEMETENEYRNF